MLKTICLTICIATVGSLGSAHAQTKTAASADRTIPYSSPAAALADLRAKNGVVFSKNEDWLIAKDTDGANWSFTPSNHYAHPSVARRMLMQQNGSFYVETNLMCMADKPACDRLHQDYVQLDRRMNEAIRAGK